MWRAAAVKVGGGEGQSGEGQRGVTANTKSRGDGDVPQNVWNRVVDLYFYSIPQSLHVSSSVTVFMGALEWGNAGNCAGEYYLLLVNHSPNSNDSDLARHTIRPYSPCLYDRGQHPEGCIGATM